MSLGLDIVPAANRLVEKPRDTTYGWRMQPLRRTWERDLRRVVIGDVIEHVNNPVRLLQFARRHLAPDGLVLVSTPNPYWIKHVLTLCERNPGNKCRSHFLGIAVRRIGNRQACRAES